jgi:hypothetical protein
MLFEAFALFAALQQTRAPQQPLPASPVVRIVVEPDNPTVQARDSLQLRVRALDASGNPVSNAEIRFTPAGAYFEGTVEENGLVRAGSTGVLPVSIVASVPGTQPFVRVIEVRMVPGPAARIDVQPLPERMLAGQYAKLRAATFDAAGNPRQDRVTWRSATPAVAAVTEDGLLTAVSPGRSSLTATAGNATATIAVQVLANVVAHLHVVPARTQVRTGDVVRFSVKAVDAGGRDVAGVTPNWTFAPGQGVLDETGAFVAYEPGEYLVTALVGSRTATAIVEVAARDVTRPISLVGRLPRTLFSTEEVWVHPDGKFAYLGTGGGGDRVYAIDVSSPGNPRVTDSLVVNARRINDVMTTPDGRVLVLTREGAADRRNGIVIASLADPAHPKMIAEFTEGVTSGVHSAFVYHQPKYGTHVYLTNDGTGALHIVDLADPARPKEVAQWRVPGPGPTLHDVDVQDGLAYLSYWNDNLIILDVGNGMKGGSPSNPQLVSQYRYDLNALYKHVEESGGAGFIRGTHTAWRHRNYVFIADEVFPSESPRGAKDAAASIAYGRLQVIDVSDIEKPESVAWFEPEVGGVHNVWVAGDTLYLGAYNGGFHVYDIAGELRGDLRAQGRRIARFTTADMEGHVANTPMTWGVVVKDGLMYVNDMNNGLWILRLEPKRAKSVS